MTLPHASQVGKPSSDGPSAWPACPSVVVSESELFLTGQSIVIALYAQLFLRRSWALTTLKGFKQI